MIVYVCVLEGRGEWGDGLKESDRDDDKYLGLKSGDAAQPQHLALAQLARVGRTVHDAHDVREVGDIGHFVTDLELLGQFVRGYRCDELTPEQRANAK